MARKIKERNIKSPSITIIGEGLTERCYFKHLKSIFNYRYICKPRNFSQQSLSDIQKQIDKVLADDGIAVCVFDADATSEDVIKVLHKYIPDFSKHESFLSKEKWVSEMVSDGKLDVALNRAKKNRFFRGII